MQEYHNIEIFLQKVTFQIEPFYKKKMQKANQTGIRIRKVIKRKGDKTYVKWKDYNNSSNSWID